MSDSPEPVIYQLKVALLGISPMIWRRLLVKSDSTIEDLHYTLHVATCNAKRFSQQSRHLRARINCNCKCD
ncbi:hypothetical protein QM565_00875 [Geitlerinema splendidum]|nr:hypothetical protein [Geitlerinema splendidum]